MTNDLTGTISTIDVVKACLRVVVDSEDTVSSPSYVLLVEYIKQDRLRSTSAFNSSHQASIQQVFSNLHCPLLIAYLAEDRL